ncbi:hypothetical protein EJB05_27066, partial [Eragrostis curvula]
MFQRVDRGGHLQAVGIEFSWIDWHQWYENPPCPVILPYLAIILTVLLFPGVRRFQPFVPVACSISAVPSGPYLLPRLQPPSSSPTRPDSPRRPLPCPIPPVVLPSSRAHVPARRPARTAPLSRALEFSHRFAAATPRSGCPSRRCASEAFAPCFPVACSADSPHPQPLSVVAVTGRRKKTCSARIWLLASLDTGKEATRKRAWQSHLGTSSFPHHILHTLISLLAVYAISECSGTSSLNQRRKHRQPNPICSEAPTSDNVSSSAHSNYLDDSPTNFDSESTQSVRRRLCAQPPDLDNQRDEVGTQRHTKRKAKYSTHRLDMLTCSTSGGGPLTCDTLLDGAPDTANDFPMGFAFQSSRPVRRRLATHPSDENEHLPSTMQGVYAIVFDDDYTQCYTLDVEYSQIYYCTFDDEYSDMLYPR